MMIAKWTWPLYIAKLCKLSSQLLIVHIPWTEASSIKKESDQGSWPYVKIFPLLNKTSEDMTNVWVVYDSYYMNHECENFRISVGYESRFDHLPYLHNENYSQIHNFYESVSLEQLHTLKKSKWVRNQKLRKIHE